MTLSPALLRSPATWNVLAQQVMMGMADVVAGPEEKYSMDQWPGTAYDADEADAADAVDRGPKGAEPDRVER